MKPARTCITAIALLLAILRAPPSRGQEFPSRPAAVPGLRRLSPSPKTKVDHRNAEMAGPENPLPKQAETKRSPQKPSSIISSRKPSASNRVLVPAQSRTEKATIRKVSAQEPVQPDEARPSEDRQDVRPAPSGEDVEDTSRGAAPTRVNPGPELLPSPSQKPNERLLQFEHRRPAELSVNMDGELITLTARGAPLSEVVEAIAEQHGLNMVAGAEVEGAITVTLKRVSLQEALRAVLLVNGYTWHQDGNILIVSDLSQESRTPNAQRGALVRVFELNFVAADDVDKVVQGLLSPVGKTFITASQSSDKRKTREELVVQDLPEYLERIEQYVAQVDRPPRQVLVEAHILQVDLRDEFRHGVNLAALARVAGAKVTLKTVGLAAPAASPAMFFGIDGTDLDSVLEAARTLTDAKTLASPKVLVVNGQEAKLQVGGQLGYFMTTTTQTSSMQSVQFLDVGVVLTVTPVIADDGNVLMSVKPEVSKGRINPQTNLPEKDTTQTMTTLMLQSGQGMVIGGLIQETDQETISKVPFLGDIPLAGWMFRRKLTEQRRQELIIAVVPRIVPLADCAADREQLELDRALTPLLQGPVCTNDRTQWEPVIPGMREKRPRKDRECEEAGCNPELGPRNCDTNRDDSYVAPPDMEEVRSAPARGTKNGNAGAVQTAKKPPIVPSQKKKALTSSPQRSQLASPSNLR